MTICPIGVKETKKQIESAEEIIAETDDLKLKADLKAKNGRRVQAIREMETEAQQEANSNQK